MSEYDETYDDSDSDYDEEEGKNECQVLYHKLSKYHRKISRIERLFLYMCIMYISAYILLGIVYMISTGHLIENYIYILIATIPIISSIITVSNYL